MNGRKLQRILREEFVDHLKKTVLWNYSKRSKADDNMTCTGFDDTWKIDFTYLAQPPRKYTFEQPRLKAWTEGWCKGRTLNLFAGKVMLDIDEEIRNDVDVDMPAEYHVDAYEFVSTWEGEKFDTIILDPPYNLRKAREKYGDRYIGSFTKVKNELVNILNDDGHIISFGYDSVGMSKSRGFRKIAIALVVHGGDHNDTIVLVEERIDHSL